MSVEEIVNKFKEKPYLPRMGVGKLRNILKSNEQDIRLARIAYKNSLNNFKNNKKVKVLIVDIETSPLRAYVWSRWNQNIYLDQTISEWFMLCWSAKWLGDSNTYSDKLTKEEVLKEDDKRITIKLWKLLDEADIVVAHNGDKFDIPKMNSRFILNGLFPTSPYKQIDTKKIASKQFGFSSNKLDALATYFGIENKDDTDFELWVKCLSGDEEALDYMEKYNIKDVIILEKVFLKLLPWIPSFPNMGIYMHEENVCSHCGSKHIKEDSFFYTNSNKFKTYRCNDCGGFSRSRVGEIKNQKNILTAIPK